ncbi:MAG: hypothetical protein ABR559_01320 [Gemmatimonadota bacterium]
MTEIVRAFCHLHVARSLKLYDRVEEAAAVERAGFRLGVELDAVAQGKLGIRMHHVLE